MNLKLNISETLEVDLYDLIEDIEDAIKSELRHHIRMKVRESAMPDCIDEICRRNIEKVNEALNSQLFGGEVGK